MVEPLKSVKSVDQYFVAFVFSHCMLYHLSFCVFVIIDAKKGCVGSARMRPKVLTR